MAEIEGHTDDRPISNARFPSNWELSGTRAASVARYLESQGVPAEHLRSIGYAHTRPIAENDTTKNRASNRRVEFVISRGERNAGPQRFTVDELTLDDGAVPEPRR